MSETTASTPDTVPLAKALPRIRVPFGSAELVARLETAARRGKFAGFVRGPGHPLFQVRDFGGPFESILSATSSPAPGGETWLSFDLRLRTGLVWVYLAVLLVTVWPGVWLTDSMLRTYFTGYDFKTWMWYLPVTVPVVPWAMCTTITKSRRRGLEAVGEVLVQIAGALGGEIESGSRSASPSDRQFLTRGPAVGPVEAR